MKQEQATSYLYSANAPFVEELYARYLADPHAVSEDWRRYFQTLGAEAGSGPDTVMAHQATRTALAAAAWPSRPVAMIPAQADPTKQVAVLQLVSAYRIRGHEVAATDPIDLRPRAVIPELDPEFYGLAEQDLDTVFHTGSLVAPDQAPLREILDILRDSYCGTISAEYMHINDTPQKRWLQQRIEGLRGKAELPDAERRQVLERVIAAEEFEKYLHHRYVGQKRFSLEGAESLIPMLDTLIQHAGSNRVEEVVMGMAHRGRLNVLTNILGKSPGKLFQEFEGYGDYLGTRGSGDVKYHMGFSSDIKTPGGVVHLALAFNPSHLEIISPVVEGSARARQVRRRDGGGSSVLPIVIHGDAAFSGQGVVMETFNMSQARGFTTGGTVHIVINNRIGFTTSNLLDARSSANCTDVARVVQAPIFHVNGDDPEAVVAVARMALDYRMVYRRDVVIDLICYRRHGHSEADEPVATQPMMYSKIRAQERLGKRYADRLITGAVASSGDVSSMIDAYRGGLDQGGLVAPNIMLESFHKPHWVDWAPYLNATTDERVDTAVPAEFVVNATACLNQLPEGFVAHPQVRRILDDRLKMSAGELPCDWGFAETMAYASLVSAGTPVRLSGQDSGRGTFFHRHAILHNQVDGSSYSPLANLARDQAQIIVIDSVLSEEAVLAFEFGYSTAAPYELVIWEAQFGDFANGAQVVIDQFISSCESKWARLSGLVLFLPHGYDGQGPEHSSARLERYLQLCAEDNMQVCMPSVPAQMFHLLRRQALRKLRKPLVVMTPKSLLRHKLSVSALTDITEGRFLPVIGETSAIDAGGVRRVVVCSGKVYFDLVEARAGRNLQDIAIIRLEQLYPFPAESLARELQKYASASELVWCQEEPQNQGAWQYVRPVLLEIKRPDQALNYAGRPASASPAVGYYRRHVEQLQNIVDTVFSA